MSERGTAPVDWAEIMEAARVLAEAPADEQEYGLASLKAQHGKDFAAEVRRMLPARPLSPLPTGTKPGTKAPPPPVVGAKADVVLPPAASATPAKVEAVSPSVLPLPATSSPVVATPAAPPAWNRMAAIAKAKAGPEAGAPKIDILALMRGQAVAKPVEPETVVEPKPAVARPSPPSSMQPKARMAASPALAKILSQPALASPRSAIAPGLLGEIADFFLASAMYPSEKFAKATALALIGTLISRRIAGPSGSRGVGTHHYQALIGTTANGKEHVRTTGKLLLTAVGASGLIGPGRFKSGAGIVKHLIAHPVSLNFMDELGAVFAMLADPKTAGYVRDVNEVLRELWGLSWGRYDSPSGALDKTETVIAPALSIIGMTTPHELYRACRSRDVANGFLNRFTFVEEKELLPYQEVSENAMDPPAGLIDRLRRLYQPGVQIDPTGKPPVRLGWGPGAKAIFDEVREACRTEKDERRRDLLGRTAEKTVRVATTIAAGDFADVVTRDAMAWALAWVRESDTTLWDGVCEYMEEEKLEFDELCREIIRRIRRSGGTLKERDIKRSFQGNVRFRRDLDSALHHLTDSEQLIFTKEQTGGRPSYIYSLPKEENGNGG
jgi:hypothetical protein